MGAVSLRHVLPQDLDLFFVFQQDTEANWLAAFVPKDPQDRAVYDSRMARGLADPGVVIRTVLCDGAVAGSVLSYLDDGLPEVSYWIDRRLWGQGTATAALEQFLDIQRERPLRARVACDNTGSVRVLEKCGFVRTGRSRGFANARGAEIDEYVYRLD